MSVPQPETVSEQNPLDEETAEAIRATAEREAEEAEAAGDDPEELEEPEQPEPEEAEPHAAHICPLCDGTGSLESAPPQDPYSRRCEVCDGFGEVTTGSRVAESIVRGCQACGSTGWVDVPRHSEPPPREPEHAEPAYRPY